jgi:phosphatidylglycerophosphatase A
MGESNLTNRSAMWLATGLGVGLVTPAPGTIGGLWGLPLAWAVGLLVPVLQVTVVVVLVFAAVAICTLAARALGGGKDPQAIVLDEIVALPIVYLGVWQRGPAIWIAGFLLFRLFDISKPPPCRQFERLPAGWGIVADDCVAALYACLALHGLLWLDNTLRLSWLAPA